MQGLPIMTTELISLASPSGRLEALSDGTRKWLRVGQICPTLGVADRTFERILQRDPSLVPPGHTAMLPWPTEGGEQLLRVYSLDVVLNVAMEINNREARRFRRWVVSMLRGETRFPRSPRDALARLPDARAILAQPMVRQAIARLDAMDAADSAHQRQQARARAEATRLAAQSGLSLDALRKLRKLERILAEIPSLAAQPALDFDPPHA